MLEQASGRKAHRGFASVIEMNLSQTNDPQEGARLVRPSYGSPTLRFAWRSFTWSRSWALRPQNLKTIARGRDAAPVPPPFPGRSKPHQHPLYGPPRRCGDCSPRQERQARGIGRGRPARCGRTPIPPPGCSGVGGRSQSARQAPHGQIWRSRRASRRCRDSLPPPRAIGRSQGPRRGSGRRR